MKPEEKAKYIIEKHGDKSWEFFNELLKDCKDLEEFNDVINIMVKSFNMTKTLWDVLRDAK